MGYKVMYCAQSTIFHVGGGTLNAENPFKTYLNFRNNLLLIKKNLPFGRAFWVICIRFMMDLLALLRFLMEGKRKDAWAVSRAHQSFVLSLFKRSPKVGKSESRKVRKQNTTGIYRGSIVWDFFVKKKTHFTDLDPSEF
jgi:GT2 family glycosyltransferase